MTVLIKNALIYDGSGKAGFKGDVFVKNEKIAAIGNFPLRSADELIDARGMAVTPGFVDVNTDSDHYLGLFSEPYQSDFLKQGVTTIIGGNCGSSLAPLIKGSRSLIAIRKWSDINQINVNWHTLAELLEILQRQGLGVNFGTLVGHSTIRRSLVGEALRDLTDSELAAFKKVLETAFGEGALGFSTGLGYVHSHFVPYREIKALAEVTARFKRVYATHLRDETEGLLAAVNETLSLAKDTGVKTEITHFRPLVGYKADYDKALEMIQANAASADVNFDLYPFDASVVPIYTLLPEWAKQGGLEVMSENIAASDVRSRLLQELPNLKGDELAVAHVPSAYKSLSGKTLKEFAANREIESLKEALLELMRLTALKAVVAYRNINFEAVLKFLKQDQAIVSSNGAALPDSPFSFKPERYYHTFPKFFKLVKEKNMMPFETAVFKTTGLPARKYSLKDRGLVKESYYADLVVLRDGQPSEVLVNGQIAVKDSSVQKILAGKILKYAQ